MPRLVHWEIQSTDVERSKRFYADLFGWSMQQWSPEYALFDSGDGSGGGISLVESVPAPCIMVYVDVEDIEATLTKAESLGGRAVRHRTEIGGGMGFLGELDDPCGCRIGLWSKA